MSQKLLCDREELMTTFGMSRKGLRNELRYSSSTIKSNVVDEAGVN